MKLTKIELPIHDKELYCVFCGQRVMDFNGNDSTAMSPCPHTLFVATDEGFEYISPSLKSIIGEDPEIDEDLSIDEYTDDMH